MRDILLHRDYYIPITSQPHSIQTYGFVTMNRWIRQKPHIPRSQNKQKTSKNVEKRPPNIGQRGTTNWHLQATRRRQKWCLHQHKVAPKQAPPQCQELGASIRQGCPPFWHSKERSSIDCFSLKQSWNSKTQQHHLKSKPYEVRFNHKEYKST